MKRRAFITLLGGAAAWPLAARAQQGGRLPTIGLLGVGTASGWVYFTGAFVQRLRELGWIEGRTVAIEYRWAEGRRERFSEIAAEFVGLKVDVIVTGGDAAAAAKQVTPVIPIVFALGLDPLGSGLVANLARPGGNVTGLSFQSIDIAGKRVELLHEIVPQLRRLAILVNVGNPQSVLEMGAAQAAARMLGLEVATFEFRRSEDIVPAFDALNGRVDAIYVCGDALVYINRNRINILSVGLRLPTVHLAREFIEAGGLMSYGPSMLAQFRRAAELVDKRGETGRYLRGAADQVRTRHQPNDRQGDRPHRTAVAPCPRRRGDRVKRREFITLLGGAAAGWPLAARAQQQPKMLRVGFVGMQPRESPLYANFVKRMAELGYQEGRNFTFNYIQTPNVDGYDKS